MPDTRKLTCGNCNAVQYTVRPKVSTCPSCGEAYGEDAGSATFAGALGEVSVPTLAGESAAAKVAGVPAADAPADEAAKPTRSRKAKG